MSISHHCNVALLVDGPHKGRREPIAIDQMQLKLLSSQTGSVDQTSVPQWDQYGYKARSLTENGVAEFAYEDLSVEGPT
ncbi:MAG: hypothetical protein ACSLFF_04665 [Solirubrobacterales bacterium]